VSVYLWQADGPRQGSRGICDVEQLARDAAADLLRSGQASFAVIEEAVPELGMRTLTAGYWCTGQRWQARVGAAGRVRWVPVRTGSVAR
jgi:hypothetical protein